MWGLRDVGVEGCEVKGCGGEGVFLGQTNRCSSLALALQRVQCLARAGLGLGVGHGRGRG